MVAVAIGVIFYELAGAIQRFHFTRAVTATLGIYRSTRTL